MHDIICPNCGERFLGYDVSFDMTSFVLPLLCAKRDDQERVQDVKFRYYVDEDTIRKSNPQNNAALLRCNTPGGPGYNDTVFTFKVNGKTLFDYILSRVGPNNQQQLLALCDSISALVDKQKFSDIQPVQLSQFSMLYHMLFGVSDQLISDISIDDEHVRTALEVVNYLYKNRANKAPDHTMEFPVCIYSADLNAGKKGPQYVPDILFVQRNGVYERLKKCCRFCGNVLPKEFGYYKMKPVVLLGSHAAGKTSYLLSLLHAVLAKEPFISRHASKIMAQTLNDDVNLHAFMKNIDRFRNGQPPEKTDFTNVPILNLLVQDTIYSFIDWPGEKFISGEGADADYIYKSRRVITKARHVIFFLPPEQVDLTLPKPDEEVCFDVMKLNQSLSWHLAFPDVRRMNTLIYVINKVDKLHKRNNTEELFQSINGKDDYNVYSGNWNQSEFSAINESTANYILHQNAGLYHVLNNLTIGKTQIDKFYIPVAPYGRDVAMNTADEKGDAEAKVVHHGFLAGVPFLCILRKDGLI